VEAAICILCVLAVAMLMTSKISKQNVKGDIIMNDYKELRKSATNRVLCGVCGGIGEYFKIDPTIIRLLMVIFGLTGGGVIAYIIAAIIIPE